MIETKGLESHKKVELAKKSDEEEYSLDIFPKLTRISRTG